MTETYSQTTQLLTLLSMNNPFKIDFRKWLLLLTPTVLRKKTLYHYFYTFFAPIVSLYRTFYRNRALNNFYAKYDTSLGNLQRMLNILYPSETSQIIIVTTENSDVQYMKKYVTIEREDKSAYVGIDYIDKPTSQKLFKVTVPSDLQSKKDEIAKTVERYTLPGYGFKIS